MNSKPLPFQQCLVGNAALDDQHKELLSLIERSEKCLADRSIQGFIDYHGILHDLFIYTNRHCDAEESLLGRHGDPHLAHHTAEHLRFREQLTDFLLEATKGIADKEGLHQYLIEWCSHHAAESDGVREVLHGGGDNVAPGGESR